MTTHVSRERREAVIEAINAAPWDEEWDVPDTRAQADAALAAALPDPGAFRTAIREFEDAMYRFWCVGAKEEELDAARHALIALVFGADDAQAGDHEGAEQ